MNNNPHGGDIYSQEILWDFSTNINPLGAPESVKDAVRRSAEYCTRYPDVQCRELTAAIASHHGIEEGNILCANGAADFIYQLVFALRPRYALLPAPTFSEYERALRSAGCQVEHLLFGKEQGFAVEIKAIRENVINQKHKGQKPEIIFLCNPNNPTGLLVKKEDLETLAAFAEGERIRLVLDECFLDFLEESEKYSLISALTKYPHLVIIKAFTKLYGMAGLRLGYGISADAQLLKSIQRMRQPWSVSVPAQMAGIAALNETEYVLQARKIIAQGRIQLSQELQKRGFFVWPSRANYLLFQDLREGAQDKLYQACRAKKLLLRSCADFYGLDGSYYRICIKTKEENEHLLVMLDESLTTLLYPSGHA